MEITLIEYKKTSFDFNGRCVYCGNKFKTHDRLIYGVALLREHLDIPGTFRYYYCQDICYEGMQYKMQRKNLDQIAKLLGVTRKII